MAPTTRFTPLSNARMHPRKLELARLCKRAVDNINDECLMRGMGEASGPAEVRAIMRALEKDPGYKHLFLAMEDSSQDYRNGNDLQLALERFITPKESITMLDHVSRALTATIEPHETPSIFMDRIRREFYSLVPPSTPLNFAEQTKEFLRDEFQSLRNELYESNQRKATKDKMDDAMVDALFGSCYDTFSTKMKNLEDQHNNFRNTFFESVLTTVAIHGLQCPDLAVHALFEVPVDKFHYPGVVGTALDKHEARRRHTKNTNPNVSQNNTNNANNTNNTAFMAQIRSRPRPNTTETVELPKGPFPPGMCQVCGRHKASNAKCRLLDRYESQMLGKSE